MGSFTSWSRAPNRGSPSPCTLHDGEGGPEAFLAVRTPALTTMWTGSYETGFSENDDVTSTGDLPNIIVVTTRHAGTAPR